MMSKPNVLLFFIDALRYELVDNEAVRRELMPTIAGMLDEGSFAHVVSNAGATQYVLPSILTQSYPFDYGGYDRGIRDRPKSIIELFKESGYATYGTFSSYLYARVPGFFRGLDHKRCLYPVFRVINKVIVHQLSHELKLMKAGDKTKEEVLVIVREWFNAVLGALAEYGENHPKVLWAKGFERRNRRLAVRIRAELELLEKNPDAILRKLEEVDSYYYWTTFGDEHHTLRSRSIHFFERVYTRLAKPLFWTGLLPRHLRYQDMSLEEMTLDFPEFLERAKQDEKPWFACLHILNIHSFQVTPGFMQQLSKYRHIPAVLRKRKKLGRTWQPLMHDLTLFDLDRRFSVMVKKLKAKGLMTDNTVIAVFGDHGIDLGDRNAVADSERGFRSHRAFLDTVLGISGTDRRFENRVMIDSQGLSATIVEAAGLSPHPAFKGVSAFAGGKSIVISETAGRGSCDLERKNLFFTLTSETHKLFTVLKGSELEIIALVDTVSDPDELHDIKDVPENAPIVETLLAELYRERGEILKARGFQLEAPLSWAG